jgi:biotin carboxyl carrier protein
MSEVERTVMFMMPNLLSGQIACIAGTTAGRSWDLGAGTFTIGRLDEHDLCLSNEPGVSKTHAKIVAQGDRYVLVDCESRNGTILNGTNIQKAEIYDGDEIRICGCVLRFQHNGGPPRPKKAAAERTQTDLQVTSTTSRPQMPAASPTATYQQPQVASLASQAPAQALPMMLADVGAPPAPSPPPPPVGRVLAGWYAAGFAVTLVLGGAGSAALALAAPEPPVVAASTPTTTTTTTTSPAPPPPPAAVVDAGMAAAMDAGAAAAVVDAGAAVEPSAGTAAEAKGTNPEVAEPTPPATPNEEEAAPTTSRRDRTAARATSPRASTSSASSSGASYPATVDGGDVESVRTRTGGRVASIEVADGATVTRGQRLLTFDAGGDPGDLQTLQDRIASLESSDDEEAKRDLKTAKAKLAALESGRGAPPVVAGSDGKLTGFNVAVGMVLKPGEVVGKIGDGEVPTRVRIAIPRGLGIKTGQSATLVLKSGGTADGTVVSVSGRSAVIDTGAVAGDAVDAVKF